MQCLRWLKVSRLLFQKMMTLLLICECVGWAWGQQQETAANPIVTAPYLSNESEQKEPHADQTEISHIPQRRDPSYEDWRKPQLPPNMQSDVAMIESSEEKGITRELLHVQWRELDPIDLWVLRPTGSKKPPVILYLYSYPTTNDRYKDAKFCEFLTQNGFAAVGFVSALTGQRFHDRPTSDWFVGQLQEALGSSVHDVQMVLNYLEARGDMDMTRVGMWGDGSGAAIAIMAAAVDPRIKTLDLLDPWGDWPNWLAKSTLVPEEKRKIYVAPNFLGTLEELEPVKLLPTLKIPIRIQQIDSVTVTPAIVRQHVEAAAPAQAQVVHYRSSKEFFNSMVASGKTFTWIREQIASSDAVVNGGESNAPVYRAY